MALWSSYGAGNFKAWWYLPQFSSDPIQTLWGLCFPWGNAGYYFSWAICQVLQNFWHFEFLTWESWENLKSGIHVSWKQLIVEWNGRKFGTQGTTAYICRVLLIADSLRMIWGHWHFAKFPKHYSPICIQFHQNFIQGIIIMGQYRLRYYFFAICQKCKKKNIYITF